MEALNEENTPWNKEEACIELTNHLIILCKLSFPRVSSLSDITSQLFVLLFGKIIGVIPHDLIAEPQTIEHEAHNIQIIIDTLSLDILNISLSHITGEDIIAGNALSIYNLLEIFENFLLYPSIELEESTNTTLEPPVKDKSTNTSNNGVFAVSSVRQSSDSEKLSYNRCPEDVESRFHADHHFKQDEGITMCSKPLYSKKVCPLCTYTNKEATDLSSENKNSVYGSKNEVPLRDSSPSSMTAYQALPDHIGAPVSLKFLSNETSTSSSPPVQEQVVTESSTSVSPPIAEHYSNNNNLNPEFAKIGLESEQKKIDDSDPSQPLHPYIERELESFPSENTSDVPSKEAVQPIETTNRITSSPKQQTPLPTYSTNKSPVKKNVRFCSQDSTRSQKVSSESMKRRFDIQNERYFKERLKNCMDDLETVVESSEFISNVHSDIFTQPKKVSLSPTTRNIYHPRKVIHNMSPRRIRKVHRRKNTTSSLEQENLIDDNQFLQELQREFPYVYLSPASIRRMQQQYNHHLRTIGNHLRDARQKKSRTQIQYEEAERRREILSEILQKETAHSRRMRFLREQRQNTQRARTVLRETQQSRVHMKQLYDSYQQYIKQKTMRKRTKEERLLSQLYEDGLSTHKEELRDLRQRAKEREEKEAEKHRKYMESMENFYQSQFSMLAESLATEKQNFQERAKAQARVLDQMRRDYRHQMEKEVKSLQDQLIQDDDIHFREMDAERVRRIWHKKGFCSFFPKSSNRPRRSVRQSSNRPRHT